MRNCFNCPVCTSPLAVSSINPDPNIRALQGPYVLGCGYCHWTSLDIGWRFEKASSIHTQITKLNVDDGEKQSPSTKSSEIGAIGPVNESDTTFNALQSFYRTQLSSTNSVDPIMTPSGSYSYNSPSNLARIMNLYTGRGNYGKKDPSKSNEMRESISTSEGLRILDPSFDQKAIERIETQGWSETTGLAQQADQRHFPRFIDNLRPIQPFLRTKRSKRCRTCRHILVKPESKVQSTRFKIKLVALNYIPSISLKPLQPAPTTNLPSMDLDRLSPLRASQLLLTLKNPLFDSVRITLATPALTPGRFQHKVTVLCPEFDIGANIDQWDEALNSGKDRRTSKHLSLTKSEYSGGEGGRVAEAGKVWEKGRNWTTVVLEVVCANIYRRKVRGLVGGAASDEEDIAEDEDLLEIPVFVRMEWEGEAQGDEASGLGTGKGDEKREKRELAYWVVLGLGRVGRLGEDVPVASNSP